MGEQQVTNVYAQALFEAAREAGTLDSTGADLDSFASAMREAKDLTAVLYNPRVGADVKKRIVSDLAAGGDRLFVNGVKLLIDKGHATLLIDFNDRFQKLVKKEQGLIEVEVTSAFELPEEARAKIRKRIEGATSKKVEITETIDEGIIGGLVLRFGDIIVDGSLKSRLEQLRSRLVQANLGSDNSFETAS
ncbi:MAG: ATP synthase F1 subunit delta [Gaiellales bacterium]|nr:MAG: ATP synthase F1 subunit delta [Gaiellales bacterium]